MLVWETISVEALAANPQGRGDGASFVRCTRGCASAHVPYAIDTVDDVQPRLLYL